MTMNDTWGYKSYDTNFKSTETLLRNLIDIASKGGNYLLNIGPDSHGIVPAPEVERLHQMGQWLSSQRRSHLRHPGHPLRRPKPAPSAPPKRTSSGKPKFIPTWNWRSTTAPNKIYIEIFSGPNGGFHLTMPSSHAT